MELVTISPSIQYIGVDDKTIDLFESQYIVPHGISYNSYVILDEKIAVMDTVDARATGPWLKNLADVLGDRKPDYLVVSHMEPDHASNIQTLSLIHIYLRIETDERDKRIRRLYTTEKAEPVIQTLYRVRRQWHETLIRGLAAEEVGRAEKMLKTMAQNAYDAMESPKDGNEEECR